MNEEMEYIIGRLKAADAKIEEQAKEIKRITEEWRLSRSEISFSKGQTAARSTYLTGPGRRLRRGK